MGLLMSSKLARGKDAVLQQAPQTATSKGTPLTHLSSLIGETLIARAAVDAFPCLTHAQRGSSQPLVSFFFLSSLSPNPPSFPCLDASKFRLTLSFFSVNNEKNKHINLHLPSPNKFQNKTTPLLHRT